MFPNPSNQAAGNTSVNEENNPLTIVDQAEIDAQILGVKKPKKIKAAKEPKDLNFVVAVNGAEVIKTLDILEAEQAVKTAKKAKQVPVVTKGNKLIGLTSFSSMCSVFRRKSK